MIEEAEVQKRDVHMSEDDLRLAAAGMQTNGISSGELEDGELEEEPKSAQAYRNGKLLENIHVRRQRTKLSVRRLMCL